MRITSDLQWTRAAEVAQDLCEYCTRVITARSQLDYVILNCDIFFEAKGSGGGKKMERGRWGGA